MPTLRPPLRRRPATAAEDEVPTPDLPHAESTVAPVAPPAAVRPPAPPHVRIDLDALRQVADVDRATLDAMMAEFAPKKGGAGPKPGDRIRATVSRVTSSVVFFDIGGKADASVDSLELDASVAVGDRIDLYVIGNKDGELRLTRSVSGGATRELLEEAREGRIPIQGKVLTRNEGGFTVELSGGVSAFCPASHIDHHPDPDLDGYVGRSLMFRILDIRGRDAIVSHRAIAEEEASEAQGKNLAEIKEGDVLDGTVTSLREFGAFIRLGSGLEGLVHISNIGTKRINHPNEALKEGEAVRVKVLGVDTERKRLSLGIRQVDGADAPAPAQANRGPTSQPGSFGTVGGLLAGIKVRK